ncbi:hypothetical protein BDW02DRAFT_567029 [Decorospora gaudefroyi]|uniref:Uncharacterized protein n=1 Tax=Decorospora gaudefroyi TaxID=184978 RepID=A0A6A5KMG0_9PLEO|nr:hypothetical protein BDW02DRAFT_567029 [Decorospora gaudefroyi]
MAAPIASTSTSAAPPYLNGGSALSAEVLREADFLQKILQIRDEVLASKHPRITLPAKVIDQVAPRLPQTAPSRPTTNGTPNGTSSQLFPPRPAYSARPPTSPIPPTQRPYSAKSSSSSIDPVLLTKSEHLVKAEQQLKRQQIERALKDQFDKKGRGNDADERETHIDVEQCLIKAHQLVPPVSGLAPPTNHSDGAESFDENSYYSSKADSWSSDEVDPAHNTNADAAAPLTSQVKQTAKQVTVHSRPAEHTVIDLDEEAYEPADDIEIYEPEPVLLHDDAEEEDYSPPPADIGPSEPLRGRARDRHGGANGSSRRQSPAGPVAPLQNPRKRRREEKRDEKRRQQQSNKRVVRSPEPYIKEEPQSPPPFSATAYPDSQPSKRRALQPLPNEVEVVAAQEGARIQPVYYRDQEPSSRAYREFDEPSSPTVIHAPQRKPVRDDQDLRRVASLQYARRPYSPGGGGEMYAVPQPRQIRAASHAFLDRAEPPLYREASARPSAAPRYVRERSRSPPYEYMSRPQSPMLMAPPPRRIVVDQYGNKFYAAPVDARESMAPLSRRVEIEPYYERAVTREPTMRAPARTELYEDEPIQRMPPPPRRYVEASEPEMIESPYRPREASRRPVEVEYRPVPQYEEMGPPREYAPARSYSMRPEVVRREVPEGFIRHESIQPSSVRVSQPRYREVSAVRQEPADERRYAGVPQGRRYVEEGPVEVVQEPYAEPRRVYSRY